MFESFTFFLYFWNKADGIVLVYDLNEPSEMNCFKDDLVGRFPSYTSGTKSNLCNYTD